MRHLGRVHRIAVKWLNEMFNETGERVQDNVEIAYCLSRWMAADVHTKAITNSEKCLGLLRLIDIFPQMAKVSKQRSKHT